VLLRAGNAIFWITFSCRTVKSFFRFVGARELETIQKGKLLDSNAKRDVAPLPYRAILSDLNVWAVFVFSVGGFFAFQLLLQYGPIYINKVRLINTKSLFD
jgi:hypothetical protein